MTEAYVEVIRQTPAPLPPIPEGDPLSRAQWTSFMAIADTVIPSVRPKATAQKLKDQALPDKDYSDAYNSLRAVISEDASDNLLKEYFTEAPSSIPAFKSNIYRLLAQNIGNNAKQQMLIVLSLLNTCAGALILTGFPVRIAAQPVHTRQLILRRWSTSIIPSLRMLARSLTSLTNLYWARTSPTLGRVLAFPRTPLHGTPGKGFDFAFLQLPPSESPKGLPETIETDVIIVGSGCGAAVSAKNLSEAGPKVIVVDKAYHWPPEHLPMSEENAAVQLFMNGGTIISDDTTMNVIAGGAWGGGGTVNWSASLQTQGYVRSEWAQAPHNLPLFTSPAFQDSLDRVCGRMGVTADGIRHNKTNQVILDGAKKLGWAVKEVPQNCGGENDRHYCGYCTLGCGSCGKKGPTETFLPDAARAGAIFIEGFDAREVLFEDRNGKKTAVGVKGVWVSRDSQGGVSGKDKTTREVIIKAKKVIISAGTLQSPLLLLRSGLRNPHIGRNLHLHPVTIVFGIWDEEVRPWEGGILTAVCSEFENLDSHGHGAKIEAMTMLPGWIIPFLPYPYDDGGPATMKSLAAKVRNMTAYISLVRERDTGRVWAEKQTGLCRVDYTVSRFDQKHMVEGMLGIAKMLYVTGAREILTMVPGVPSFVREGDELGPEKDAASGNGHAKDGINDPRFQAWLDKLRNTGFPSPQSVFGSAHQMGTCRMGNSPRTSVVDPKGKVWGVEGCYVMDASVFPSASGVNPMVTNMAIADWTSRELAREMATAEVEAEGTEKARL